DPAPALFTYTIAQEDVAGPFVKVPADLMEQAELPSLGYESPLEGLGEKFHANPNLLKILNPDSGFDKDGEQILAPNVTAIPPGHAASVVVSKSDSSVTAFDAEGKILSYCVATIGSEHDPLPIGDWKIKRVWHNPVFYYDPQLFWNANPSDDKAEIKPGPRGAARDCQTEPARSADTRRSRLSQPPQQPPPAEAPNAGGEGPPDRPLMQ